MAKFNFANVTEKDFGLLVPGTYDARLVDYDEYTNQKGNHVIKLEWLIDNQKVWDYVTVPQALWKLQQFFAAFGIKPDENDDIDYDIADLMHCTAQVKVGVKKGNGINPKTQEPYNDQNTIVTYLPGQARDENDDSDNLFG